MGLATSFDLDDFLRMGRYTFIAMVMLEILMIIQSGNVLFMVFGGAVPTLVSCKNFTVLPEHNLCKLYHQGVCDPELDYQFYSLNIEFEHLCENAKEVKASTSYQMIGYVVGSLFFGQISDVYGRKWPMFICCLMHGLFGVAAAFSTSLQMFSALKMLVTFFSTGHTVISIVYMSETFPKNHRMWTFFVISWSPNIVLVTVLAYFSGNWRTLTLVLNGLAFVAAFLLLFTHETPHYLVRRKRTEDAVTVFKKIYKFDGNTLDEEALRSVVVEERKELAEESTQQYFYQHLFCTWKLASWTVTVFFLYFAVSVVNYGILFNLDSLSGSLYLNTAMNGVFRCILNVICSVADINLKWLGRKISHGIFSVYTLFAIIVAFAMKEFGYATLYPLLNQFNLIGACSIVCQIYAVAALGAMEIYPTQIRNVAFAVLQFGEALATIAAPQLFLLTTIATWLPFAVLIGLQFLELVSYHAVIPESKGRPLEDKMPPEEEWFRIFRRNNRVHLKNEDEPIELKA